MSLSSHLKELRNKHEILTQLDDVKQLKMALHGRFRSFSYAAILPPSPLPSARQESPEKSP